MPVSVCNKATANVTTLHRVKNGVHNRDIFANQDGGPPMTCGIISVTNNESGGTTLKAPGTIHFILTEGEISMQDGAKPGEILVLSPGDVARIDKGTVNTLSSPRAGKGFCVAQIEFGTDSKNYLV